MSISGYASAQVTLTDVHVQGVDTLLRAEGFKHLLLTGKRLGSKVFVPILNGVSFTAKPGERIGIIGRNGAGKSSLLRVIAGIYPPQQGTVSVTGKVAPLIEMGIGFETGFTGRQNIKLGLLYGGRLEQYSKEMEERIIEFSGLGQKIDVPIKIYSSGMRARLAFAIAVFQDPDILLLDEAFAMGDAEFVQRSSLLLREKFSSVPISILVSHGLGFLEKHCNRCLWMDGGRIIADGPPGEVISRYSKGVA